MNKLSLILLGLIPLALNAQIKELYADNGGYNETVVIKEKQADDQEILSQNFQLSNYKIGDVIRITTAPAPKKREVSEIKAISRPRINQSVVSEREPAIAVTEAPAVSTAAPRKVFSARSSSTRSFKKKKKSNFSFFKNKKLKNRKVRKVKRYSCYKF